MVHFVVMVPFLRRYCSCLLVIAGLSGWQFFRLKRAVVLTPVVFLIAYFFNAVATSFLDSGLAQVGL